MTDTPYETPDPSLVASIQHQAEKLGYLVSQVEEMFANRAQQAHRAVTVAHSTEGTEYTKRWLAHEISDEELAQHSAELSLRTSALYDNIKAVHQQNINTLNQMVVEAINRGKSQQSDLDQVLQTILNDESE